jgi:hypothetical protein
MSFFYVLALVLLLAALAAAEKDSLACDSLADYYRIFNWADENLLSEMMFPKFPSARVWPGIHDAVKLASKRVIEAHIHLECDDVGLVGYAARTAVMG